MARNAFFSFHYEPDNWRAAQVRQMGIIEGNAPCSDNDWESVTRGGEAAIKRWIQNQLYGRTCLILLVGSNTANRIWINHEIIEAWNGKKAVFGVNIHGLQNRYGQQSAKGLNPFDFISLGNGRLSSVAPVYDPPYADSKSVYNYIKINLADWIEKAINLRGT